jgi:hypothetical protein
LDNKARKCQVSGSARTPRQKLFLMLDSSKRVGYRQCDLLLPIVGQQNGDCYDMGTGSRVPTKLPCQFKVAVLEYVTGVYWNQPWRGHVTFMNMANPGYLSWRPPTPPELFKTTLLLTVTSALVSWPARLFWNSMDSGLLPVKPKQHKSYWLWRPGDCQNSNLQNGWKNPDVSHK